MNKWPTLIHYGSTKYIKEKVKPITNAIRVKPNGGLWTSPVNSKYGWKDWCEDEEYRPCDDTNSFKLKLHNWAKVYIIDSLDDLKKMPVYHYQNDKLFFIDFENLSKSYDAIWLTEKGEGETRLSYPIDLYGWDCESVLIMNPESCYQID